MMLDECIVNSVYFSVSRHVNLEESLEEYN